MELLERTFEEIKVGDEASFMRTFTDADVAAFSTLSGDENPLNTDPAYAASTPFQKPVVHGMLVASHFSALLGMRIPGKQCLLITESVSFRKPVYAGEELTITGVVSLKSESTRILEITLTALRGGEEVANGTASVQVRA